MANKKTSTGLVTITICLRSLADLGWQKNACSEFRANVASLMGMASDDVQTAVILGVPTAAIKKAGRLGSPTFTIEERGDNLRLLVAVDGSDLMYSQAHISKIYELEPSTLVDLRKKLQAVRAGEEIGDAVELEHKVQQAKSEHNGVHACMRICPCECMLMVQVPMNESVPAARTCSC